MPVQLPKTYKAIQFNGLDEPFQLVEKEMPKPRKGQVLVKMAASPINPSDVSFLEGNYANSKPLPLVPGFEASGTVVTSGGGLLANYVDGKRVGIAVSSEGDGAWSEYILASANSLVPLHKSVSLEQGAMSIVNPLTVYAFLEIAKKHRKTTLVNTAAASQVGRMLLRWADKNGVTVINIVRNLAQVKLLKSLGAEYVLNSSKEYFMEALETLCRQLDARLAFDAVAGRLTGQLLDAMPQHSIIYNYGGLSKNPIMSDSRKYIFEGKSIRGFWLPGWMAQQNMLRSLLIANEVQKELTTTFKSEIQARFPLSQARQALEQYQKNMTGGKVLLVPER